MVFIYLYFALKQMMFKEVFMEKNNSCDALKRLARQAKNRLGKRNYLNRKGESKVGSDYYLADYKLVLLSTKEDEKLYLKVKSILSEDEDVINPLGKLVDKNKFFSLSEMDKERYIFNLAEKYRAMKERYKQEKEFFQVG